VRQVGYLQELNRDARTTKHKNLLYYFLIIENKPEVIPILNSTPCH